MPTLRFVLSLQMGLVKGNKNSTRELPFVTRLLNCAWANCSVTKPLPLDAIANCGMKSALVWGGKREKMLFTSCSVNMLVKNLWYDMAGFSERPHMRCAAWLCLARQTRKGIGRVCSGAGRVCSSSGGSDGRTQSMRMRIGYCRRRRESVASVGSFCSGI